MTDRSKHKNILHESIPNHSVTTRPVSTMTSCTSAATKRPHIQKHMATTSKSGRLYAPSQSLGKVIVWHEAQYAAMAPFYFVGHRFILCQQSFMLISLYQVHENIMFVILLPCETYGSSGRRHKSALRTSLLSTSNH
jgi:hypothetical protein